MCSSIWIKTKKETINPVNEDDNKCLQYAATLALDYAEFMKKFRLTIKNYQKLFINKHNWKDIHYLSQKDEWEIFDKNNPTIAFNVLNVGKEETIYPRYISKHKSKRKKQSVHLITPYGEGWHYLVVTRLSVLLRGITSTHNGNFFV